MTYLKLVEVIAQKFKGFLPNSLDSLEKNLYISEIKPVRTNSQNAYYWCIIAYLVEQTGNDKNKLHDFFKNEFLQTDEKHAVKFGISYRYSYHYRSTTELNTKQFTDYIERICVFVADFGIGIPQPKDPNFNDFLEHYKQYI
jgi:hypothetical protein